MILGLIGQTEISIIRSAFFSKMEVHDWLLH